VDGITVLLDKTGKPLQIDYETCEEMIHVAINATVALEAHIPKLAKQDKLDQLIEQISRDYDMESGKPEKG
jgi:uncharacterized protein YaaN involved in tellurite resistance